MLTLSERSQQAWLNGNSELSDALWQAHLAEAHEDACKAASIHIGEAMGQYATEDFLSDVIAHVTELSKSKVTKSDMIYLIARLEQKEQELNSATEYGIDELKQAKFEMRLYTAETTIGKRVYK
jgi:hypothetical protein